MGLNLRVIVAVNKIGMIFSSSMTSLELTLLYRVHGYLW